MTSRKWKKKADVCWNFGLINNMIPMIWKKKTKILMHLNRTTEKKKEQFRKPERSDIMRHCLSGSATQK